MRYLGYLFLFSICFACGEGADNSSFSGQNGGGGSLTEEKMVSYLKVFNQLKEEVPDVLELVNENEQSASQQEQFVRLEKIILGSGMDYEEFVAISNQVGTVFSISEANMDTYQDLKDNNQVQMQEAINSIQEMIDDPDVPADKKAELQQALKQAQQGKAQLGNMFEQNREKAEKMYQKIQKKLGKIATQAEVEIVHKYQKELEEAYQGISRPRIEGSL